MADFRRLFTALALLALFAGLAAAQAPIGGNINCTQSLTVTPTVRGEGLTELVGDIVLGCSFSGTGAPPAPTPGQPIPTANITVFLTNPVTSRIMNNNGTVNASEALLILDEPGSPNTGGLYGPTAPQTPCPLPQGGGCLEYMGTPTSGPAATTLVPIQGSSPSAGLVSPGPTSGPAYWNIFQGVVSGNSVTFYGVPILPPTTAAGTHVYRITNIRVNANQGYNASSPTPSVVQASISISPSTAMTIPAGTVYNVAYVSTGLNTATRKTDNSGDTTSTPTGFTQCGSVSTPSSNNVLGLRFSPGFPTAFKPRVTGPLPAAAINTQNIPGQVYNSESGFTVNVTGSTGVGNTTGLADWGTRLKAVFNNIPSGVTIWVGGTNYVPGSTTIQTAGTAPYAQAVISETAPDANNTVPVASTVSKPSGFVPLVMTSATTGYAVWEVENINSSTTTGQDFEFGVALSYGSGVFSNTAAIPITVNMSLAPNATNGAFSASTQATATQTNVPRFVDTSSPKTVANITLCQTTILFPYVTTVPGFDTGMAVANTSQDPFGTTSQNGTCTVKWYEAGVSGTNPPDYTTPVINAGTVFAWGAVANTANTQFTGYAIALCNFAYGHGYAAVTDVGARSILSGYLPLIIQNSSSSSRTGGSSEALDN